MPCLAQNRQAESTCAADRGDNSERGTCGFKLRPLLDVCLEVAVHIRFHGIADPRGIKSEIDHRLAHGHASRVRGVEVLVLPHAGHRFAAKHRDAESHPLLVAEADDLECERKRDIAQLIGDRDAEDDSERAVIAPGIGDGVEVRAEDEGGQARLASLASTADVARGVGPGGEARLTHPAVDEFVSTTVFVRQMKPSDLPLDRRDRAELIAATQNLRGGHVRHP